MVTTYFCPRCWHHESRPIATCPRCGHDLASEVILTYEERLLSALSHPVREQRMIAIEILGRLRYRKAVPHIAKILETEQDYYLIREGMKALTRIGGLECDDILWSLSLHHHSPLVRTLAEEFLQGRSPITQDRGDCPYP